MPDTRYSSNRRSGGETPPDLRLRGPYDLSLYEAHFEASLEPLWGTAVVTEDVARRLARLTGRRVDQL